MMGVYRRCWPYGLAIGSTAMALQVTLWLKPLLSPVVSPLFYIAIIVSAWYGGFRPGMVAVVLSSLAISYYFIAPVNHVWVERPEDLLQLGFFLLGALTIALLTDRFQESKKKVERLSQQLAQENTEQLRMALSAAQMGMWDWNLVTGEIKWSPEHALLLGLDPGAFDGRYETFDARVHPEDRQALEGALQEALQTRSIYQHVYRVIWPDGSTHWVEGRGHGFYDAAGKPVRMTGTILNTDARKQAETLLHQQFEQQRLVMEITQRIRQSLNLEEMLQTTVDEVRQFMECDRVIMFQFAPDWSGTVVVESVASEWTAILSTQIYDPCFQESYVEPFKQGLVTAKSDIYTAGIDTCHLELLANLQVRANLVVGIPKGEELWGLLIAHQCASPREWQPSEIELMRQLATQAGIAIQQADLFERVRAELRERQLVEAALRESQIQLQRQLAEIETIYQSAPIGLNILDTDLRFVRINQRLAEMNGFSVQAHIGRSVRELLPDMADAAEQLLLAVLETGKPVLNVELTGETPAQPGVQRTWVESFLPLKDGERVIGISTVCEEITERKQAQLAMQESEEKLRLFIHYAPASILMFDREMRYIAASQRWLDELRLTSITSTESIIGRSHYELFPNLAEDLKQSHQRGLAGSVEKCAEYLFTHSDGLQQWFRWEVHPWYRPNGDIGGIILFSEDITERKQAQLALQQLNAELEKRVAARTAELTEVNDRLLVTLLDKENAYQLLQEQAQLLELAHDSIITWDLNSAITFWNRAAQSMYGWSKAEAFGQESHALLKTQFPKPLAEIQAELLEKGYWEGELVHFTRDNRPVAVASRWVLQKDGAGRPVNILEINNEITERKKAELVREHYIREVEDLYNNAPCGYHSLDEEGTIIRINETELNWLGYSRDEVLNKKQFVEFITPESQEKFLRNFPQFKQQGFVENLEFKVICKDGSIRWVNVNATALKDDAGNFLMSRSSLFDISDRKRAEEERKQAELALRESEERRRLALDLTHTGFWDWHIPTGNLVWNDNYFTLLGLVPGAIEPSDQIWRERVHPEDRERVQGLFACSLEARIDYEAEYRVVRPDGSVHWVLARGQAIYDESGQPVRSLGVLLDISERKRAEEALRQYERIVSNTKDGIALINRHYIYQIANPGYLDWCNKAESEVLGNSVRNILGHELFDSFIQPRLDSCLAGETIQYERWFDSPNLVPQFLSVTYTPYRDAGEKISGVIVSLRDLTRLKQAEQMLELQAEIARNMAEGVCLVRADNGIIVHANPKFERMFGYDAGELDGQHVSIVNYATESVTAEEVNKAIRAAILQNRESTYEVYNVKKDGTPFWCSATSSVFRHPDFGDVLVAVHQDITERKRAQELLQQQAKQEKLLFSITQAIRQSLELNAILHTAVTEVKQTLQADRAAIYRFNPDWSQDFLVESVAPEGGKLVSPDIPKVWEDTYLQQTGGGRFQNGKAFAVADIYKAGLQPCHIELLEQFQARAYAIAPIFSGQALWGLLAIYQNAAARDWQSWEIELLEQISTQLALAIQQSELYRQLQLELHERKQTQAILQESERRWRSLLDNVQLLVVGLDPTGAVNYVNPFFLKLTGCAEPEVLGQNWFETFVPVSHRQQLQKDFSEILASNAHPYYQSFIVTKLGEERFIAWNHTLLRDSAGSIIGTVSIGEDITVRQKIEQMKNEFIGIVSHELRTPLTAIRASLGLLKTGVYDKKPDKFKRMIEIALIDSERLVRLVNDILDLERLESGRAVLEKATCKAADLILQAVEGVRAIADRQHIALSVHLTDVEVSAASDAIVQTLTNLLSNALKFSPPDTAIEVRVERQADRALFHVSDRGRGIPPDKLEAIFGRFQQVDASDSRDKGGTGLGLAICRSIIEQHGGLIWVESTLGAGSTFFFTLPLSVEHANDTICL